jgi:YbbR domain-containing protein
MQRLRQNLFFKILSLACAFALFLYVGKQQSMETPEILLPLELTPPPGLQVVEPTSPRQVRVRLSGPADRIRGLDESQIKATIDLVGRRKGTYTNLPVEIETPARLADTVQVLYSSPTRVTVKLDEFVEKPFQVEMVTRAEPPVGYSLGLPQADPPTVTISGLGETVKRVRAAVATITEIRGTRQLDEIVRVSALDERGEDVGEGLQIRPATVRVKATLERTILSKPLYVDPDLGPLPPGMRLKSVRVTPERVTATGSDRAIAGLWVIRTRPISLPPAGTRVDRDVALQAPPGVRVLQPAAVRVEIELEDARRPVPAPSG